MHIRTGLTRVSSMVSFCNVSHIPFSNEYKRNLDNGVAETACSLEMTRFYVAEIVQALEYMHSKVPRVYLSQLRVGTVNVVL